MWKFTRPSVARARTEGSSEAVCTPSATGGSGQSVRIRNSPEAGSTVQAPALGSVRSRPRPHRLDKAPAASSTPAPRRPPKPSATPYRAWGPSVPRPGMARAAGRCAKFRFFRRIDCQRHDAWRVECQSQRTVVIQQQRPHWFDAAPHALPGCQVYRHKATGGVRPQRMPPGGICHTASELSGPDRRSHYSGYGYFDDAACRCRRSPARTEVA